MVLLSQHHYCRRGDGGAPTPERWWVSVGLNEFQCEEEPSPGFTSLVSFFFLVRQQGAP